MKMVHLSSSTLTTKNSKVNCKREQREREREREREKEGERGRERISTMSERGREVSIIVCV
jgi:hypothetical protein